MIQSILVQILIEMLHWMTLLVIPVAILFLIHLAYTRYTHSTTRHVGILAYTHRRLEKLAYDSTHSLPLFIPLCTLLILYEAATRQTPKHQPNGENAVEFV